MTAALPRLEIKFLDPYIGGQPVRLEVDDVVQTRIIGAELARQKGFEKTPFKIATRLRRIKRQRGVDRQRARGVRFDASIQRVQQMVGFAEPKRRRNGTMRAGPIKNQVDRRIER